MKVKTLITFLAAVAAAMIMAAQEGSTPGAIPVEAVKEINKEAATRVEMSSKSLVEEQIKEYCRKANIAIGIPRSEKTYGMAVEPVLCDLTSPNFIRSRAMAYQKAYRKAIARQVMYAFGKNLVDSYGRNFADYSTEALQPSVDVKTAQQRIKEKIEKLTEAELDHKLQANGVSSSGTLVEKTV